MKDFIIDIPNDDPFKNDKFERDLIINNFMKIIKDIDEPLVIGIDSGYGTGKTTLIKMWESLINNDEEYNSKYETLYFNAWSNDYMEDPLIAILSEIELDDINNKKKTLEAVKKYGKKISRPLISTALKVATSGIINMENVNLGDDIEKYLPELSGKLGEVLVNDAVVSKKTRAVFKQEMKQYQETSDKKVIFFIDELDRCKPRFAIDLLETIKHLFDMENFIFIVSIDKAQLAHSIATIYGQGMDTNGYLRRFFDFNFELPSVDKSKYIDNKFLQIPAKYKNIKYLKECLTRFMIEFNFSLRDIDKAFEYIKLLIPLIYELKGSDSISKDLPVIYLYSYLITLKVKDTETYKKIINCNYSSDMIELKKVFDLERVKKMNWYGFLDISDLYIPEIFANVLEYYLILNYKLNNGTIDLSASNSYKVGIKTSQFDMAELFEGRKNIVCRNLEFISQFK